MNRRLGIAHLSAIDLPPAAFVSAAARAGFNAVGLRLAPAAPGSVAYPLRVGSQDHIALRRQLSDEGMIVYDAEFIPVTPDIDIAALEPLFEDAAALGATSFTVSGDDADKERLVANLAAIASLAAGFPLRIDVEFMRWRHIANLSQAYTAICRAGNPNLSVLVDALHLFRSGGSPEEVAVLPASALRAVQLCDGPSRDPVGEVETIKEAREGRLAPGDGTFPLRALMRALPDDIAVSVEMPYPSLPVEARLRHAYDKTQVLLASVSSDEA